MIRHGAWWLLLGAVVLWLAGAREARAQGTGIEVLLQVKPANPVDPKKKNDAPQIELTVIGAPNLTADKFSLRPEEKLATPIELKPVSKRDFIQGSETMAIAIVLEGWEIWIGNDDYIPEEDPSRFPGILKALEQALDKVNFKEAGPKGSLGMVITYADKASTRIPMGPLERISGSALGTQSEYKNTKGVELVKAVQLAISELSKVSAPIKVMIVISDGDDTNPDTAKAEMTQAKRLAAQSSIQVFGIIYKGVIQNERNFLSTLTPTTTVNSAENIVTTMQAILSRMAARQYLLFNGFDTTTGVGLPWDGKQHNLILKIDNKDMEEPIPAILSPVWKPATAGFPWLVLTLIVLGVLLLIFIGVKVFKSKPAPMPMPVAMPMPMEAPKPMGPAKTVMIGAGGDEGGFPIVGWLVPLNGSQAYQTFRLRSGGTKIGTAPPCDVVVNDGFMSTEHCMIQCSPQGFTLVDGGSTNGCYVNDRKIQSKQDLVDNDMVTLGKTNFKFKSIN
jgi:FHA domain/von Willebrand factor type A domain